MSTQRALGIRQDGGMVEPYRVPSHKLIPLPRGLDVASASLAEPASVRGTAPGWAAPAPAAGSLVIGGGSVGQLAAAAATAQGAEHVALVARHPHQHAARERLGFAEPDGDLYDVVIEAAGSASALQQAVDLVLPGGKIAVLGVHYGGLDVPYTSMLRKEVTLVASLGYSSFEGRREMVQAAEMLAARPEIADTLITHRFPLRTRRRRSGWQRIAASGFIKVVVDVHPA